MVVAPTVIDKGEARAARASLRDVDSEPGPPLGRGVDGAAWARTSNLEPESGTNRVPRCASSRKRLDENHGKPKPQEFFLALLVTSDGDHRQLRCRQSDAPHYPLFLLLARTGLRPGEAYELQWTDLAPARSAWNAR